MLQQDALCPPALQRLKGLCGGLSHDINNMVGVILAYLDLLKLETEGNEDATTYLDRITLACRKFHERSQAMEEFSGCRQYAMLPVQAKLIVNQLKLSRCVFEDALPSHSQVLAEPGKLTFAFQELVDNALEAEPDGNPRVWVGVKNGDFVFQVVNRCDLKEEQLERLWDPYFSTRSRTRGMGLARVLGVVTSHKGQVETVLLEGQRLSVSVALLLC
jgi:two-component system NtrC family sensor kinase